MTGCSDSATEPAASQPSLSAAVTEALELRNTIRDGFANGDVDAAHGPLHEIGHCLLTIPPAAEEELSAEDAAVVSETIETLMDAFGEVDKTLHGGEGSTYEEEAKTIDAAFTTLTKLAGVSASDSTAGSPEEDASEPAGDGAPALQEAPPIEDATDVEDATEIQDASAPPAP